MKIVVIVNKDFKQLIDDKVLFDCPLFCEIETENPEFYESYLFLGGEELVYLEKLNFCFNCRKQEYEKLNQFEMQYDDLINNTTTWKDAISAIKGKYPKPIKVG